MVSRRACSSEMIVSLTKGSNIQDLVCTLVDNISNDDSEKSRNKIVKASALSARHDNELHSSPTPIVFNPTSRKVPMVRSG
jgi:hypothetical protein